MFYDEGQSRLCKKVVESGCPSMGWGRVGPGGEDGVGWGRRGGVLEYKRRVPAASTSFVAVIEFCGALLSCS